MRDGSSEPLDLNEPRHINARPPAFGIMAPVKPFLPDRPTGLWEARRPLSS